MTYSYFVVLFIWMIKDEAEEGTKGPDNYLCGDYLLIFKLVLLSFAKKNMICHLKPELY